MSAKDFDKIEGDRVHEIMNAVYNGRHEKFDELFKFEEINTSINDDKIFHRSFDERKIIGSLPFSRKTFVAICPLCVGKENFGNFKKFVDRKLITPVLTGSYSDYPDELVEYLWGKDHISGYEFGAYRYASIVSERDIVLCQSCAKSGFDRLLNKVSNRTNGYKYKYLVEAISGNIYPYVDPDYQLFDMMENACQKRKLKDLGTLKDISFGIRDFRTMRAFNAPVIIDHLDIENLPQDFSEDFELQRKMFFLRECRLLMA